MRGKRELLANASSMFGFTSLLAKMARGPRLFSLNLHRVGDAAVTPYDSGVFSCTANDFEAHLIWLKSRFRIVSLADAEDIIHGRRETADPVLLLTFDDGYRDNYDLAFPLLKKHGLTAAFFLPTAFVGTSTFPWWDSIAFIVKNSQRPSITLQLPEAPTFALESNRDDVIRELLTLYKRPDITNTEAFIAALEEACDTQRPGASSERAFLNWEEAREMQGAGMGIGSHTHTHPVLSKLSYLDQLEELGTSREIVSKELRREITSLAYPVGSLTAFTADSKRAAAESGYQTAYSFYSGSNVPGSIDPLDVRRAALDNEPASMTHLRAAALAALGKPII